MFVLQTKEKEKMKKTKKEKNSLYFVTNIDQIQQRKYYKNTDTGYR